MFQVFYDLNENQISLTGSHLIYVLEKGYVKANHVRIGDKLRIYSEKENIFKEFKVKRIDYQIKEGFIAPLTNHGTILVNGIDSSCYADINSHHLADFAMLPFRLWYKISKMLNLKNKNENIEFKSVPNYFNFLHLFTYKMFPFLFK